MYEYIHKILLTRSRFLQLLAIKPYFLIIVFLNNALPIYYNKNHDFYWIGT